MMDCCLSIFITGKELTCENLYVKAESIQLECTCMLGNQR